MHAKQRTLRMTDDIMPIKFYTTLLEGIQYILQFMMTISSANIYCNAWEQVFHDLVLYILYNEFFFLVFMFNVLLLFRIVYSI